MSDGGARCFSACATAVAASPSSACRRRRRPTPAPMRVGCARWQRRRCCAAHGACTRRLRCHARQLPHTCEGALVRARAWFACGMWRGSPRGALEPAGGGGHVNADPYALLEQHREPQACLAVALLGRLLVPAARRGGIQFDAASGWRVDYKCVPGGGLLCVPRHAEPRRARLRHRGLRGAVPVASGAEEPARREAGVAGLRVVHAKVMRGVCVTCGRAESVPPLPSDTIGVSVPFCAPASHRAGPHPPGFGRLCLRFRSTLALGGRLSLGGLTIGLVMRVEAESKAPQPQLVTAGPPSQRGRLPSEGTWLCGRSGLRVSPLPITSRAPAAEIA
jgi:hypothetical protein